MAKIKPARGKKKTAPSRRAMPCLILLIAGMALLLLLFYFVLKSN